MTYAALARFEVSYRANVVPALADDLESSANAQFDDVVLKRRPQVTQYFLTAESATNASAAVAVQDRCDVEDFRASMSIKQEVTRAPTGAQLEPLVRREAVHMIVLPEPILTRRVARAENVGSFGTFSWGPWHHQVRSKWRIDTWPGAEVYLSIDRAAWDLGDGLHDVLPSVGIEANFPGDGQSVDCKGVARALLEHARRLAFVDQIPMKTLSKVDEVTCRTR